MWPMKIIYSREKVRQGLHCNTVFHLLLSHHNTEKMQDSELLFRPAELSWISFSVHANVLKFLWHFFRASDATGISDEDGHVRQRLLLQYLPACHDTPDANCEPRLCYPQPFWALGTPKTHYTIRRAVKMTVLCPAWGLNVRRQDNGCGKRPTAHLHRWGTREAVVSWSRMNSPFLFIYHW